MNKRKMHWSSSDDILPECNPRGSTLCEVTTDQSKVTCCHCLKIINKGVQGQVRT